MTSLRFERGAAGHLFYRLFLNLGQRWSSREEFWFRGHIHYQFIDNGFISGQCNDQDTISNWKKKGTVVSLIDKFCWKRGLRYSLLQKHLTTFTTIVVCNSFYGVRASVSNGIHRQASLSICIDYIATLIGTKEHLAFTGNIDHRTEWCDATL